MSNPIVNSSRVLRRLLLGACLLPISTIPWLEGWQDDPVLNLFYPVSLILVVFYVFSKNRLAGRLLFSWSLCILFLCLADLAMRPWAKRKFHYRPHEMYVRPDPEYPSLTRYKPNTDFKGTVYGDLAAMLGKADYRETRVVDFVTDAHGFRNRPEAVLMPIDTIVIGDSFTAGIGVGQDQSWPALLNSEYGRRTYNLGMPGGPWQSSMHLQRFGPRLNTVPFCTVVWMIFLGNDLDDSYQSEMDLIDLKPAERLDVFKSKWRVFRDESTWKQAFDQWFPWFDYKAVEQRVMVRESPSGEVVLFSRPYYLGLNRDRSEVMEHFNYDRMIQTLHSVCDWVAKRDWRLILVLGPPKSEVLRWLVDGYGPSASAPRTNALSGVLTEFAKQTELPLLDLYQEFFKESVRVHAEESEWLWWRDDSHWNVRGHRLAAKLINEKLTDSSPVPTKNKGPVQ